MDGGMGDLLSVFLNNPDMIKKAGELFSKMSAAAGENASAEAASAGGNGQAAAPVMAQTPQTIPAQDAPPQTENAESGQNPAENTTNMSGAPPEGYDQLATMVSSVMSALGMSGGGQASAPQTETPASGQNPAANMSGAPPEGYDQLATMVSSVMSALGMSGGGQASAPPTEADGTAPETGGNAAPASGNFDIERALGVLKNVSKETSPQKDNRIQLLLSLKPFLKDGRKQKVDMAVKYLNAAKVFNMFGKNGFI